MEKVIQLVKGCDNQVRGAKLKVLSKSGKQMAVFCPLQKLIPFEITENQEGEDQVESKESKVNGAGEEN